MKAAKRIESGVYDYCGFRIVREFYGWAVLEPSERGHGTDYEGVDAFESLTQAKRAIDNWDLEGRTLAAGSRTRS